MQAIPTVRRVAGVASGLRGGFARMDRAAGRSWMSWALVGLAIAVALARLPGWTFLDLHVYQHGARNLVHRQTLYVDGPALPFTYPPFAALLFVPAYLFGDVGGALLITLASLVSYLAFVSITARRLGAGWPGVALLVVLGTTFEPISHTFGLGQVNLVLAATVVLDCLVMVPRHRGWLIGIAAGIKLVPAVFVIYLLVRGERRACLRAAGALAATIALSAAVAPRDAWRYWTHLFYSPGHVGGVGYVGNQSLYGDLVRLSRDEHPSLLVYGAIAAAALGLATLVAQHQHRLGNPVGSLVAVALGGLLVSPVSWTHHWVWLLPAAAVLVAAGHHLAAGSVAVVGIAAPMWFTPRTELREFHHTWWQAALCLSYAAAGLLSLIMMLRSTSDRASQSTRPRRALTSP